MTPQWEKCFTGQTSISYQRDTKKPGGRAGLRKFARAMRSMFGSVRAARALQDDSILSCTRALARESSW